MWLIIGLLLMVHYGMACDRSSGPPGIVKCILIPRYNNQYQWATCLTDTYIKQKSSQRHQCIDRSRTYCWYQCMLEVNDKNNGPVTNDCSCSPSQTTIYPPISPTTPLPAECYSPSGKSCDWYRNCLERKYPCEPTTNAYAIAYAEKFCRLYDEHQSWFTEKGQNWIDGVRKCLQVSLVPLLRPWSKPTCKEIRDRAFVSHTPCYLNPDKDAPSICDLECGEYFKIFFVIKGAFSDYDTAWESMKGMWNIGKECGLKCSKNWLREKGKEIVKITRVTIQKFQRRQRPTSNPLPEADARSRFTYRLGSAIASSMSWNMDIMDWLSYPSNTIANNNPSSFDIFIVLVDKKSLGIVNNTNVPVDLNNNVQALAVAIKQGKLPLQVDGSNVWLKSIASCSDKFCEQAQTLAVSDKPPHWNNGAAKVSKSLLKVLGLAVLSFLFMNNR
uniref:Uncharacterized protein LOC116303355 n=1 Tax=Actinia tenebrosa TaxID=6105 RepID=A0A6P8IQR0_ACTTE